MKVSSIIVGALAAVVSATPIPGKEVSKRSSAFAFGAGNVFGNLAGAFDPLLLNNFQFQDPLLAHLALVSGIDGLGIQNLAINNGLALDGFAETLLFQAQAGQLALSSILSINTLATVSWLLNNNFLNTGLNVGGLALPNALSFGLLDQFGFDQFAFNVNINDVLNQEILASLSNSLLFSGGGFGGAAVVSSVQSTVIVKE